MHSEWRCENCGPVEPLHVAGHISAEVLAATAEWVRAGDPHVPLWCPWPMPAGWLITGVAWAGDERYGARASAVAVSGPDPVAEGPADVVFVAELPGVGLGSRLAGVPGPDPGPALPEAMSGSAHAKVIAAGHPTPLWAVESSLDRCAYVGAAKGLWLYTVAWPATAGYLLADQMVLRDLTDGVPSELAFGAPSPHLHARA